LKLARFSRFGFLMAAAGAAVGLGNIWKFPYITGEYGGGAFVAVYLITVILIGFSIMIAEMSIGYLGRKNCVDSIITLAPKNKGFWSIVGWQGMTGVLIMSYYSVIIGWILYYFVQIFIGLPSSVDEAKTLFEHMYHKEPFTQIFYHTIAFLVSAAVVAKGIKSGIERFNVILMPLLIIILAIMFIYAINLDGFSKAFTYMFYPDFSKLTSKALTVAVGHAFFTLALGFGGIMIYSASLPKGSNLVKSSIFIIVADTLIALVAGLILFALLFEFGSKPDQGPGLIFISLPVVFYEMGFVGSVFAFMFFIALAFAGLTSAVALMEPMVQYFEDKTKLSRAKISYGVGFFFYLLGILVILSNIDATGEYLTWGKRNFFDWADFFTSSLLLPLAGLMMAIFVGFVVQKDRLISLLKPQLGRYFEFWYFSIRYIATISLALVLLNLLGVIEF